METITHNVLIVLSIIFLLGGLFFWGWTIKMMWDIVGRWRSARKRERIEEKSSNPP